MTMPMIGDEIRELIRQQDLLLQSVDDNFERDAIRVRIEELFDELVRLIGVEMDKAKPAYVAATKALQAATKAVKDARKSIEAVAEALKLVDKAIVTLAKLAAA